MTSEEIQDEFMKEAKKLSETMTTLGAMEHLKHAMVIDPEVAHSWHCNLAMAFYDAFPFGIIQQGNACEISNDFRINISNQGASRFMKLYFDVDTSQEGPK